MIKLFSLKKAQQPEHQWQDKVAARIVRGLLWLQRKWAISMQRRSERLSPAGKRYALALFIVLVGGYSLFITGKSIISNPEASPLPTGQLRMPRQIVREKAGSPASAVITRKEYAEMHHYRLLLDSLAALKTKSHYVDSILRSRPGLRDSIMELEKNYLSQNNKN